MADGVIVVLVVLGIVVVRLVYDAWIYEKLYVDDRSPTEQLRADRFRTRAIYMLFAALALGVVRERTSVPLVGYAEIAAFGAGFYFLVRATQQVSNVRMIAAFLLFLLGAAVLVVAGMRHVLPGTGPGPLEFTPLGIAVVIAAVALFAAAAKLSRRSPPGDNV